MPGMSIQQIPKIDLHCHLDGSLTLQSVRELLGRDVEIQELRVKDDCRNLAEYLEKFDVPLQCLQTSKGLRTASREFLLDVAKENVRYIEVRFAPLLSVNDHLNCRQVVEAVLEGLEEAKKQCGVFYNVIICAMRHHTDEESLEMIKVCREFLGEGVCAADLAGNEAAFPMENFRKLFGEVKKLGFPFTIHAGECGRVENVTEAVECGAARIGHGIALRGHQEAMQFCAERRIGIEMCPISNLQTKAVSGWREYPIREFMDAGLWVTLNTDNRMVSNTSIAKEMEFVQQHYGITLEELVQFQENAAEVSFADDAMKHELLKLWQI